MSFYGSVSNAGKTTLTFDKVYPNRKLMEENCKEDGVFIGRCVLIEYDDNTFAYMAGYVEEWPNDETLYTLYADTTKEHPYWLDTAPAGEEGYALVKGDLIRGKVLDRFGNIASVDTYFFVCEGVGEEGYAAFRLVDVSKEFITDYDLNYNIDKKYSDERNYVFTNGWDSTVWQKVAEHGEIKYRMVSSLNSETPTFSVRPEAPSIDPIAPHFAQNSTNMSYILHMPTVWGFKVKNVEDAEEGEIILSDEKVTYVIPESCKDAIPEKEEYQEKAGRKGEEDEEEGGAVQGNPDLNGIPYNGAIYYNKAGFNKLTRNHADGENKISILPTGYSSNNAEYYVHDTEKSRRPDMQELVIQLPAIGNAVSELWDLMYGDKDGEGHYLKSRNDNIEWNDTSGIRMIATTPDTGGFAYMEDKVESVAGAINSLHDLMGMIISAIPEGQTKEDALEMATSNKIYFGSLGDNENQKNFYYKGTEYKFEPFATIPELNAKYEAEGKPVPFPDFDAENFVGSRTYYDLIQFVANMYYTYADNNFYIDANDVPTPDTTYYRLGEPKVVALKEWHGEVMDEETGEVMPEETYYLKDGNYIKDTSDVTDENKQYFSIAAEKQTYPEDHEETKVPRLIWNPKAPIFVPNDPDSESSIEDVQIDGEGNADRGVNWSELISGTDEHGVPYIDTVTAVNKDGYFFLAYEELAEGEEKPKAATLILVNPDDSWEADKKYYKVPVYVVRTLRDEKGELVNILYFVKADGTLVSFESAVDALENGNNKDNIFPYDEYRVNMIDFVPGLYFSEATFEVTQENGEVKTEEGYMSLLAKEAIDDSVIYYTLTATPLTGDGDITAEPPAEGEEPEAPAEDILLTHYYKPGVYYFKNSTNDYILSTSKTFSSNLTYYLLTDKNGVLLERDPDTKLFKIEPEQGKFYEPNKYYYFSNEFGANLMDTGAEMKTPEHEDVHPEYIREEVAEDGSIKKLVYFIPQLAYVVEDTAGFLNKGMVWDKNVEPPNTVTLGGRYEEPVWVELKGFSRTLNTVNGLILQLNKYFKFDDKYVRNNTTVQGCLNQLNDIINLTDDLNPGNIIVIDDYGRMSGALLDAKDDDGWITSTIETKAKNTSLTLAHTLPNVADENLSTVGAVDNQTPKFGESASISNFKYDAMGHVRSSGTANITMPSLAVDNNATGDVVTGLSVSADGQSIVAQKATIDTLTASSTTIQEILTKVNTLTADSATEGSVAYQVAALLNDADASDIDTLEEIAAWITNDTTGATKMANDIANLNTLVGTEAVSTQITNAISNALNGGESGEGAYITSEQVDEKIKDFVKTDALNSYVGKDDTFTYGEGESATQKTIQDMFNYILTLENRIKTLEDQLNSQEEPTPETPVEPTPES